MTPFTFARAVDAADAVARGATPGTRYLGGGTNLVDLMRETIEHPATLIDGTGLSDAIVHLQGTAGSRTVPLTEFHLLPEDHPERETVLQPGELVTAIEVPALSFAARSGYRKVRDRASYAFALVSVAAALDVHDGIVRDVRLALGGVAHKPWRAWTAERMLKGRPATEELFAAAASAELADARPLRDNAFKIDLCRRAIVAVLAGLVDTRS